MPEVYTFPTVQTLRDAALTEALGNTNPDPTSLQDAALIQEINVINSDFVNAPLERNYSGWNWMEDVTNFATKSNTTLNGALTTASVSVILTSATDFDTAGRIWIRTSNGALDFIDYTGKSSNTLTGATDIDIAHADGSQVEKLYAQPSDFGKTRFLFVNNSPYVFMESAEDILPPTGYYTLQGAYFLMPEGIGAQDCTLRYMKKPTNLNTGAIATDLATATEVPVRFARYAVERLKAYIYNITRRPDKEAESLAAAERALEESLIYHFRQTATRPNRIRPSW